MVNHMENFEELKKLLSGFGVEIIIPQEQVINFTTDRFTTIEVESGPAIMADRLLRILNKYFSEENVTLVDYMEGIYTVDLLKFKPEGYPDEEAICIRCACSQNDACHDEDTGYGCYWVREDLCSAC